MTKHLTTLLLLLTPLINQAGVDYSKAALSADQVSPLAVGDTLPDVALKTVDGEEVYLQSMAGEGPLVLIFYRGGWCPYCNAHLAKLKGVEQELLDLGYQIVAISPDRPEKLGNTIDSNELTYTLLSDSSAQAMLEFGLAFRVEAQLVNMYKTKYNIDLEADSGETHHLLPVPAVYISDKSGNIIFAQHNPDYKSRINSETLLTKAKSVVDYE